MTTIEGRQAHFPQPPAMIFPIFSDLRNFAANLPEDKKKDIVFDQDSIVGKVQGFELGVKIDERHPFSYIRLIEAGSTPIRFNIWLNFKPSDTGGTHFQIVAEIEMNMMIKMMVGNKLQDAVNQITDQLESVMNGKIPEGYEEYLKQMQGNK